MSSDNRRSARVSAPHVMVKVSTRERMKSSYLKDLSEGGLFVRSDKPLPIGRKVLVDILPPGWDGPLRLSGVVTRVQTEPPGGMGLRFEDNDESTLQQLQKLLSEYQSSEADTEENAAFAEQQLKQMLERHAELQNALEQKDRELESERRRRADASKRAMELASTLETMSARGEAAEGFAAKEHQLRAELSVAQNEVSEVRARLSELEGEVEAYKHELEQLEADDESSRRLATVLAKEKADLTAEVARLSKLAAEASHRASAKATEADQRRDEAARLKEERDKAGAALQDARTENERLQGRLAQTGLRLEELEGERREVIDRLAHLESEYSAARGEVAALERKVGLLETSTKEANARAEKLKSKERELRELVKMVSSRNEEVVVVNDEMDSDTTSFTEAPLEPPSKADDRSEPSLSEPSLSEPSLSEPSLGEPSLGEPSLSEPPVSETSLGDGSSEDSEEPMVLVPKATSRAAAAPESLSSVASSVSEEIAAAEPEMEFTRPSASNSEVSVDIDFDAPQSEEAPSTERSELERRIRANEPLSKTASFDGFLPPDETIVEVKGLMEAGGRFSELMVLGRGRVTPPQLMEALIELLVVGALRFSKE